MEKTKQNGNATFSFSCVFLDIPKVTPCWLERRAFAMGKRYFCDYCDRSFQDNMHNRKKHLNGVQHHRAKKAWFDNFRGEHSLQLVSTPLRRGYSKNESACLYLWNMIVVFTTPFVLSRPPRYCSHSA